MPISRMPASLQGGLTRYLELGILPGSFLTACLENDLRQAFARADSNNLALVPNIIAYFEENLPSEAWGSREKVTAWAIAKNKHEKINHGGA